MGRWILYTLGLVAAVLGIVLTVMYVRTAQKLYDRDKEHSAARHSSDEDASSPPDDDRGPDGTET